MRGSHDDELDGGAGIDRLIPGRAATLIGNVVDDSAHATRWQRSNGRADDRCRHPDRDSGRYRVIPTATPTPIRGRWRWWRRWRRWRMWSGPRPRSGRWPGRVRSGSRSGSRARWVRARIGRRIWAGARMRLRSRSGRLSAPGVGVHRAIAPKTATARGTTQVALLCSAAVEPATSVEATTTATATVKAGARAAPKTEAMTGRGRHDKHRRCGNARGTSQSEDAGFACLRRRDCRRGRSLHC